MDLTVKAALGCVVLFPITYGFVVTFPFATALIITLESIENIVYK